MFRPSDVSEGVIVPSDRFTSLMAEIPTNEQLVDAAKKLVAEREHIGPDIRDRILRQLRYRLQLSLKEISELTGYPISLVFNVVRPKP